MKNVFLVLLSIGVFFTASSQHRHVTPLDSVTFVYLTDLQNDIDTPTYFQEGVDTVTVQGIITFNPKYYGKDDGQTRRATYIQDTTLDKWGGIQLFMDVGAIDYTGSLGDLNNVTKFYENCVPGYEVKVTALVDAYYVNSQLSIIPIEIEIMNIPPVIDSANVVTPILLDVGTFMKNDGSGGQTAQYITGEPYEGMYVRLENVTIVDVRDHPSAPGSRWLYRVQDEFGNKMDVDDNSSYFRNDDYCDASWLKDYDFEPPSIGTRLEYIQGVIGQHGTYGYNISPLLPTDMNIAAAAPYISKTSRYPAVPESTDDVVIKATITDNDGTITSASVFYSEGLNNMNFTEISMSDMGGNVYRGVIPAKPNDTIVNYYIKSVDNDGTISYFPDSLASGSHYQVVDGGITRISQIQHSPYTNGSSLWVNDTVDVNINAVVVSAPAQFNGGFMSIQDDVLPYSGIFMQSTGTNGLVRLKVGDSIRVTKAFIEEDYGVTIMQIDAKKDFELLSINNPIPDPIKNIPPDSIAKGLPDYAEAYEGMLMQFDTIFVTNLNPDAPSGPYGEFSLGYDTLKTNDFRGDAMSNVMNNSTAVDTFYLNQRLEYIKGILYYSFGDYKLVPRDFNDIAGYFTKYQPISDFEADIVSGKVPLEVQFTDVSANTPIQTTYDWDFPGTEEATSVERNPFVTYKNVGAFDVSMKVVNATAEDSITKTQYIVVTGIEELGENITAILLYPNPTIDVLNIKGEAIKPLDIKINIYNNLGQVMDSKDANVSGNFSLQMNMGDYQTGIYYLEVVSDGKHSFTRTILKK
jgi:PKD repeat protein